MARYSLLVFCAAVCGFVLLLFAQTRQMPMERNIVILEVNGPYRFTFQRLDQFDRLTGRPFTQDICQDYAPPGEDFQAGLILDKLIHDEEQTETGVCWSLNPDKHCGFYKRRDVQRHPVFLTEAKS